MPTIQVCVRAAALLALLAFVAGCGAPTGSGGSITISSSVAGSGSASAAPSVAATATLTPEASPAATAEPTPEASFEPRSDAAMQLDPAAVVAIAKTVLDAVAPQEAAPVLVGVTHIDGDWAAAFAQPQGTRTIYSFLRRTGGGWDVIEATSIPSSEVLRRQGVPETVMEQNRNSIILDQWAAQLQDPRGDGVEGFAVIERVLDDHARVRFEPADTAARDPLTAFLRREGEQWRQVLGGTAFTPTDLAENGVPPTLLR